MRQSDDERFTEFVRAHSGRLFRTAFLMTGDHQGAEDLLQTSLVRLYQRWPRVEAMDYPVGYARKVVVSQAASWWRRRSAHERPMIVREEPARSDRTDEAAEHERVWTAVLSLPPRQRAVTVLRYYEDQWRRNQRARLRRDGLLRLGRRRPPARSPGSSGRAERLLARARRPRDVVSVVDRSWIDEKRPITRSDKRQTTDEQGSR